MSDGTQTGHSSTLNTTRDARVPESDTVRLLFHLRSQYVYDGACDVLKPRRPSLVLTSRLPSPLSHLPLRPYLHTAGTGVAPGPPSPPVTPVSQRSLDSTVHRWTDGHTPSSPRQKKSHTRSPVGSVMTVVSARKFPFPVEISSPGLVSDADYSFRRPEGRPTDHDSNGRVLHRTFAVCPDRGSRRRRPGREVFFLIFTVKCWRSLFVLM